MRISRKCLWPAVLCAAVLASGCGGGGDPGAAAPDISRSASALVDFINSLIASGDDTRDPIDIDALTLVQDDTAEPAPL